MTWDEILDSLEHDICVKYPDFQLSDLIDLEHDEIDKGKYEPVICYAVTPEDYPLVTSFYVVCVDKSMHTEFIGVEYDQMFGKQGIYRYI